MNWRTGRVGRGQLHAGFQRVDAFGTQRDLYVELAGRTAIDTHIHLPARGAEPSPETTDLTIHTGPAAVIENDWFVLYDPDLVERGFAAIGYGSGPS